MRLYCLSGNPNCPCFILKYKSVTVMLDCALDLSPVLHFLPIPTVNSGKFVNIPDWTGRENQITVNLGSELKDISGRLFVNSAPEFYPPELKLVNLADVDILIVSNFHTILALPYITQYTDFNGRVYMTEPTHSIGRQFMEELVEFVYRNPRLQRAAKWKQSKVINLRDAATCGQWQQLYDKTDIEQALSKVNPVGFNEKIDIFGSFKIFAVSSGHCIGSSTWVIQSDFEKIVYLSDSSTLTTHPKSMEQEPLRRADLLLLTGLTKTPTQNPDSMIGDFCMHCAVTVKGGGNVLVPCYPSGVTFDLFECLCGHLESQGLGGTPMYFISPVAASSLAYSNIYAEWLSASKQNKVYTPEEPFPHAQMVRSQKLRHFKTIHGDFNTAYRTPCVVFAGHPSLRFGDAVHFMQMWGGSAANTVIFTEPDFPYLDVIAPYQPLSMKAIFTPIDTRLSFSQANKLIRDLKPRHLVCSEQYTSPPAMTSHRADLVISQEPQPLVYRRGDVIPLPVKRTHERVELDPQLAASLVPTELTPGVAVATVRGALYTHNNKHVLKKWETEGSKAPVNVYGTIDVHKFKDNLAKQGIHDVQVESEGAGSHVVQIKEGDTTVHLSPAGTHIRTSNETLRVEIKNILLRTLGSF